MEEAGGRRTPTTTTDENRLPDEAEDKEAAATFPSNPHNKRRMTKAFRATGAWRVNTGRRPTYPSAETDDPLEGGCRGLQPDSCSVCFDDELSYERSVFTDVRSCDRCAGHTCTRPGCGRLIRNTEEARFN